MSSRISTGHLYRTTEKHMSEARNRETTATTRASSLKQISRPSENASGWVMAANMKDDLSGNENIAKNASLATHFLNATDTLLSQVTEFVQRAHELAVSASSEMPDSQQTRLHLLNEVQTLYDSTIRALNTRYAGRTLLGGHQTRTPAFEGSSDYKGDEGEIEVEISRGLRVPMNVSAPQIIQGQGLEQGVNIPVALLALVNGLKNNDTNGIRGTLDGLVKAIDQLSLGRTQVGARVTEINRALNTFEANSIHHKEAIARIEEADAIKAFTELQRDQTALKVAISTGEKILTENPTQRLFE